MVGGGVGGWVLRKMLPGTRKARKEEETLNQRGNQEPQNQFPVPPIDLGQALESCCTGKTFE